MQKMEAVCLLLSLFCLFLWVSLDEAACGQSDAAALAPCGDPHEAQPIEAKLEENQVKVFVEGKLFTCYKYGETQKYPYFWPVIGPLSSKSITTESSEPYPHHHSLFFGCDRVNEGNYWQEGIERGQILSQGPALIEAGGDRVVFKDECLWRRPGCDPVIHDKRSICIEAPSKNLRFIDFEITLIPLKDVTILKTNHSLFSARVVHELCCDSGGVLVNAEGMTQEKGTFGVASSWCDYSGSRGGVMEGIAILQHPKNPWYPAKWFTRDYGFFSPTPMYWLEEDRLELKKNAPLTLRYRVVVHAGDAEKAGIGRIFSDYEEEAMNKSLGSSGEVKLMTLDPGHFHAALVQKTMYDTVSSRVHVYAPKGPDIEDHLKRIQGFNQRSTEPTSWEEIVYRGDDFLERMLEERPGNVVVLSGNNRKKAEYIKACVEAGLSVLADKPMCINPVGFKLLREAFDAAKKKRVLLYDIMTERFEITTLLQKELANYAPVFGDRLEGTWDEPAIVKESVHHFFKYVAGNPLKRPPWFFDTTQQGEGIVDVTTHLVDLVLWGFFPGQVIEYDRDIVMKKARQWPTLLSKEQFQEVTGLEDFPDYLRKDLNREGSYPCYANGEMVFAIQGIHSKISVKWNFKAPESAGDTHYSLVRGSKARVIIEQGEKQDYKPELYVEATEGMDKKEFGAALAQAVSDFQSRYPGIALEQEEKRWHVMIPEEYRIGHEAHFQQVTENYLRYLAKGSLPEWEVPNMITKYRITTEAQRMAKEQ